MRAVFHDAFDYVPVFVVFKTVARDGGGYGSVEIGLGIAALVLLAVDLLIRLSMHLVVVSSWYERSSHGYSHNRYRWQHRLDLHDACFHVTVPALRCLFQTCPM